MEQDSDYDSLQSPLSPQLPEAKTPILYSIACPCCKKTYVDPRVLPCLHTVCYSCLESNSNSEKRKVICPECHMDFCLPPNGLKGLIPDYGIDNFIKSFQGHRVCTSCKMSKTVKAIAKCINCDSFLCRTCVSAHGYMYCFEGHRVVEFPSDFTNDAQSSYPDSDDELKCLTHSTSPITQFCITCNVPICDVCISESHLAHTYNPMEQVSDTMIALLNSTMDENHAWLNEMKMSLKNIRRMDASLKAQHADITQKINDTYMYYNSLLQNHKDQQLSTLDSLSVRAKAVIQNHINVYQDTLDKATKVNGFHARLLKHGTPAQILMFKKMLEDKKIPFFKPKPVPFNLNFASEPSDFSSILHRSFGHVYSIEPQNNYQTKDMTFFNSSLYKYDKWSPCLADRFQELEIGDDSLFCPVPRPYLLKTNISRRVITYTYKFGSFGNLPGQFTEPNGVAINANGEIIIADTNNNRVQIFDKMGRFKHLFGEGSVASKDPGNLLYPNRVAVMGMTGDIVVTERAPTHQVQIYNQYGLFVRRFGANVLQHPRAVTVDPQGRIIVVECKVMRVIIFDQNGEIIHKFSCHNVLQFPNGVAVNDRQHIFISDNRIHCVVVYDYNGNWIRNIGREGITNYPIGVMLDANGHVSKIIFSLLLASKIVK